ncbi:glycoside hydrolase family 108 protein [Sphingomonas palmae]|nr:glycosyl hydrolase 108 family protein [Sphingomonas palmae]
MFHVIDQLIDNVIDREGGYSNHPSDRGGATRFGITEGTARANGYAGDMRHFSRAAAAAIYRRLYWLRPQFDSVATRAPALAAELFDTGVNMGPAVAVTFLQRALNALNRGATDYADVVLDGRIGAQTLAALDRFLATRRASGEVVLDGRIGAQTLAALDRFLATRRASGEVVLVKAIEALQGERYMALAEQRPANEAFLYGWLANRLN